MSSRTVAIQYWWHFRAPLWVSFVDPAWRIGKRRHEPGDAPEPPLDEFRQIWFGEEPGRTALEMTPSYCDAPGAPLGCSRAPC